MHKEDNTLKKYLRKLFKTYQMDQKILKQNRLYLMEIKDIN